METIAHGYGYTQKIVANEEHCLLLHKVFAGRKSTFKFHKHETWTFLLMSGKAKVYCYDPGENWFDKLNYNQTMGAVWHDLAIVLEMNKKNHINISPGVVYQIEGIEDCEFVILVDGKNDEYDTHILF